MVVVDLLEAVEVDEQHRDDAARALCARDRLGDAVDEQFAVGQPGQCIVGRLLGERRLGSLQLGHAVGLRRAEARDLEILGLVGAEVGEGQTQQLIAVDDQRRAADLDRHAGAVGVEQSELKRRAEPVRATKLVHADRLAPRQKRRQP